MFGTLVNCLSRQESSLLPSKRTHPGLTWEEQGYTEYLSQIGPSDLPDLSVLEGVSSEI